MQPVCFWTHATQVITLLINKKMALYSIENDTCLGISHSGAVNVESDGFVELSDEEVVRIVELIRKEGTSDIEGLRLKELYPCRLADILPPLLRTSQKEWWKP